MTGVYVHEDGTEFQADKIERKDKCFICGGLGETKSDDGFIDGTLPSISDGDYSDTETICRECLKGEITEEQLQEAIGE